MNRDSADPTQGRRRRRNQRDRQTRATKTAENREVRLARQRERYRERRARARSQARKQLKSAKLDFAGKENMTYIIIDLIHKNQLLATVLVARLVSQSEQSTLFYSIK